MKNKTALDVNRPTTLAMCLAAIGFAIPLVAYMYMGGFMRYMLDDYCYAANLRQFGFRRFVFDTYMTSTGYNSNRYSLSLIYSFYQSIGPQANALVTTITIGLWVLALYFLFKTLASIRWGKGRLITILLFALYVVFFTLYEAPVNDQIIYWQSGTLTYTMSLVMLTFLLAFVVRESVKTESNPWALGGLCIGGIFTAGFSETTAGLQAGSLIIAGILITLNRRIFSLQVSVLPVFFAFIGTLIGILLLAISPSNQAWAYAYTTHPDLIGLIWMSITFSYDHIKSLPGIMPLPTLVCFFTAVLVSFLSQIKRLEEDKHDMWRSYALKSILTIGIAYILIMCSFAPSIYVRLERPVGRSLLPAQYIYVLLIAALGWFTGELCAWWVKKYAPSRSYAISMIFAIVLVLLMVYPIRNATVIVAERDKFARWGELWDARHAQILSLKSQGLMDIEVMQMDHLITDVAELGVEANSNYGNRCAAQYYGLNSIKANLPGWDE